MDSIGSDSMPRICQPEIGLVLWSPTSTPNPPPSLSQRLPSCATLQVLESEWDVLVSLDFALHLQEHEFVPHFFRICEKQLTTPVESVGRACSIHFAAAVVVVVVVGGREGDRRWKGGGWREAMKGRKQSLQSFCFGMILFDADVLCSPTPLTAITPPSPLSTLRSSAPSTTPCQIRRL